MEISVKNSSRIIINISFSLSLFVIAVCYTIASPILIELSQQVGRDIEMMGSIFSFYFIGFILGNFFSSWIINYFSRKALLMISYLVITLCIFSLTFTVNFVHVAAAFLLIGLCGGFLESQITTMLIDLNKKNEALYVNLSQVFFGIGAFVGPFITSIVIGANISWKYSFVIAGLFCLINFILFIFVDISHLEVTKTMDRSFSFKSLKFKRKSIFILLILAMFFYVCAEIGLAGYIPTFLRLDKGFTDLLASQILSYFWLSTIFGRIAIGFLTKKIKIEYILLGIVFLTMLTTVGGIYFNNQIFIIAAFILTGLFLSGIWPLIAVEGGLKYPEKRNFVVAMIILAGGLGGFIAPIVFNQVYKELGLFTAMNLNYIFLFIVFMLIFTLILTNKKNRSIR
jgi:fucose permease